MNDQRSLRRGLTRTQRALALVLVLLVAGVEFVVLHSYAALTASTERFGRQSMVVMNLANVQAESLGYFIEFERLQGPPPVDLSRIDLRRSLLRNQLEISFAQSSRGETGYLDAIANFEGDLRQIDGLVETIRSEPTIQRAQDLVVSTRPVLNALRVEVKSLYDRAERDLLSATASSLRSRVLFQRLLILLAAVMLSVGIVFMYSMRRTVRADFERAHRALLAEMDERRVAETAARTSEQRLSAIMQNASDIIAVLDREGTISYISPAVVRILGGPQDRRSTNYLELVHPDDTERVRRGLLGVAAGISRSISYRMSHVDGSWRDVESIANNLLDDGAVEGLIITTRDVSERQLAESLLRLEKHTLELAAAEAPLDDVLGALVTGVEGLMPGASASVVLEQEGSPDAANGDLPADGGRMRDTWTAPIASGTGRPIGSFVVSHDAPKEPSRQELRVLHRASTIAGLAVEREVAMADRRARAAAEAASESSRGSCPGSPTNSGHRSTPSWGSLSSCTGRRSPIATGNVSSTS